MKRKKATLLAVIALALAACGGSDDGDATTTTVADSSSATTQPADTTETTAAEETPTTASAGSTAGPGSATLTVGDVTYEFDNYYCLAGPDNTGNDRVSLSSGSMGRIDEVRVQLDASIQDPDEEGRMEGEGTIQSISLNDIEDFENPSVALEAVTGFVGGPEWTITYDGSTVTAEALFDDTTTDEIEEIPGTLQATCGG